MLRCLCPAAVFLLSAASISFANGTGKERVDAKSIEREYSTHMYDNFLHRRLQDRHNQAMRSEESRTSNFTHNREDITGNNKGDLDCSAEEAECTLSQLKIYFGCTSDERPIHDQKTWQYLRQTYHDIVGAEKSTIGPPNRAFNGFAVPYYVDQSPGRGRGLFASRDIPKGSLIWTASRTAEFEDAESYRNFLLTIPADLACDVMMWAYVSYGSETDGESENINDEEEEEDYVDSEDEDEDDEEDYESSLKIMLDLDECSFCNDGGKKRNMDWDEEAAALYPDNSDWRTFAVKDVKKGDELLCNYSGFFQKDKWAAFGL